ncbi:hypothetical protein [Alcaligenes faecalis]|uniref:hypothetical protein n=1 Tax=Alcaligenes faecalis TaxID=511 RepID=UPI001EF0150B|nr:hypothetical protein [Alcaligenes faecalis]ULH06472.1 hypothetical protein MF263_17605 [Alcaligenes faecalis]
MREVKVTRTVTLNELQDLLQHLGYEVSVSIAFRDPAATATGRATDATPSTAHWASRQERARYREHED